MVENDISHEIEDWIVLSQLWFYWIQNVSETLCKWICLVEVFYVWTKPIG